jgi:hypothetical protein
MKSSFLKQSRLAVGLALALAGVAACATAYEDSSSDSYNYAPPKPLAAEMENITLMGNDWKDVGADTPEHALETYLWAQKTGNTARQKEVTFFYTTYTKTSLASPAQQSEWDDMLKKQVDTHADGTPPTWVLPYEDLKNPPPLPNFDEGQEKTKITAVHGDLPSAVISGSILTSTTTMSAPIHGPQGHEYGSPENPHIGYLLYNGTALAGTDALPAEYIVDAKRLLDVTILARKMISPTLVELDVDEHWPAGRDDGRTSVYQPYDFQLDGVSWKFFQQEDKEIDNSPGSNAGNGFTRH